MIFSKDAEADRTFFRDVLGLASVDARGGWLTFTLPGGGQIGLSELRQTNS